MRPRRKSPPVQFRLDLDLYEILVELAHPNPPSTYVAAIIVDRLTDIRNQRKT